MKKIICLVCIITLLGACENKLPLIEESTPDMSTQEGRNDFWAKQRAESEAANAKLEAHCDKSDWQADDCQPLDATGIAP